MANENAVNMEAMETESMPALQMYALGVLKNQEDVHYPIVNVDLFATFSYLTFEDMAREMAEYAVEGAFLNHDMGELSDERKSFWVKASYVDQVLDHIFEEYEGMPCCSDKSRTLIKMYDKMLATGEEPQLPPIEERNWGAPQHGTAQQWADIIKLILWKEFGRKYVTKLTEIFGE